PPHPRKSEGSSVFGAGFKMGSLFGIQVILDYSLIVIGFLVTFNLAVGLLPSWHPDWSLPMIWGVALSAAVLFIASVLAHELSHALVGRRVGVPIRAITLFLFGGMAHMEREPERPSAEFWTAVVGPVTSIVIGAAATFLGLALGPSLGGSDPVDVSFLQRFGPLATLMLWLGPINILLGVFNLIPGFPLDGGRVLRSILWWATGDFQRATRWASLSGQAVAWLLITSGILMIFGYRIPVLGTGFVPGLWSALLGWFLNTAARRSYEQVVLSSALEKVPIRRFMLSRFDSVPADMSLSEFVYERLLHSDQRCYPVISNGDFLGFACLADARRVPEPDWATTQVRLVMTPASELSALRPDDEAALALRQLTESDVDQIPIVDGDRLLGLVRRADMLKWLGFRSRARVHGS
ncbi:MAG TPA: site-2 protease family protein, partial [Polyangiaceae bacterium]